MLQQKPAEVAAAQESMEYDLAGDANMIHTTSTPSSANKANTAAKISKARPRPKARTTNVVDNTTDDACARTVQVDAAADVMALITAALNNNSTSMSADTLGRSQHRKTHTPAGEAMATQNVVNVLKASKAAEMKAKQLVQAHRVETTVAKKAKKVSGSKLRPNRKKT